MTTTDPKPQETDSPHTVAVDPASIREPTATQALERVHAKLSTMESSVAAMVARFEQIAKTVVADVADVTDVVAALLSELASKAAPDLPPPGSAPTPSAAQQPAARGPMPPPGPARGRWLRGR